tara:strand:+ start:25 stop:987 length:963 start_codon:yes stop_codon:yes gene_type:complete
VKHISKAFAIQVNPTRHVALTGDKYNNIDALVDDTSPFWLHFDQPSKHLRQQLAKKFGLSKAVRNILFAEEQRPRCIKIDTGFVLILQGIQPDSLDSLEDPPSLRIWITPNRLLSVATGSITAIGDMQTAIAELESPDLMTCLATLLEYLIWYVEEVAYRLDESLDAIETGIGQTDESIVKIAEVRQSIVRLRRYVLPQRDAIIFLSNKIDTFSTEPVVVMKEISDNMLRQAEMLEMLRERSAIIQDNLSNQIGEISNRRMYVLTVMMLIFTPAFFIMSLFSMYVPTPGMSSRDTWWIILLFVMALSIALLILFKKRKWL